ncbi:MAG: hypothetical protein FJ319_08445 [SAR202 cluster bacterium]|nr:hypothetical protein [SAR202 cluster bacterium]
MRSLLTLVRKDLKGYFDQPTGYILLVVFIGVSSFLFFRQAFISEEASMRALFGILPWILAVFVPAATMRLIAEEQRDGTLEILVTQPVKSWVILLSKFLTGLIFVGVGILFTIGIPVALQTAGDLDMGAVAAQYIGSIFLTAAFVSIGLFTSSLTRNQIVSFILAIGIITVLMVMGLPLVTLALPSQVAVLIQGLSPLPHFELIARGVLDLRDVLYFVSIVSTFMSATFLTIRGKNVSHKSPLYRNLQIGTAALVMISLLIGWFGSSIQGRWDLTERKIYTLNDATADLLSDLDDIVTIKLFQSKEPPVQVALLTRDVNDFLNDFAARSDGKARVVRYYPDVNDEDADEAEQSFVKAVQFSIESQGEYQIKLGYLGLGMTYANKQENIPFIESMDQLEYKMASSIYRMAQKEPKTLGMMYGHNEMRRDAELHNWRNSLERDYYVEEFDYFTDGYLDPNSRGYDMVVVPGPNQTVFPEMFNEIDRYLADGGKVLLLLDPVRLSAESGILVGDENVTGFEDWLKSYGVNLGYDVVFDLRANETLNFPTGTGGTIPLPYPYWLKVQSLDSRINGGVESATIPWSSSITVTQPTVPNSDITVIPLLQTSEMGGLDTEYQNVTQRSPVFSQVRPDQLGARTVAVAVTGTRCPPFQETCTRDQEKTFRMIVAADSEFISYNATQRYPDHVLLGQNWVDWLMQQDRLAAIRGKGVTFRQLIFDSNMHRNIVQYANVLGVPALFILVGVIRFIARRNTMRKVYVRGK